MVATAPAGSTRQIVSAISHDLRAPVRHIQAFVQLLDEHMADQVDPTGRKYIDQLLTAADGIEAKLDAMSRYAGASTAVFDIGPHELRAVVSDALAELEALIRETGAEITVGSMPTALVDRSRFCVVVTELVKNSLMFRSGTPVIEIASELVEGGDTCVLTVRDNGRGIRTEDCGAALLLFRTLGGSSSEPTCGAGLAIVERIVSRHEGTIRIESGAGAGCEVRISLPAAPLALDETGTGA